MENTNNPGEEYRTPKNVMLPDMRTSSFYNRTLETMHEVIGQFELGEHVPESIKVQYDTARNLALYSYFVYRFAAISKHHLFVTLEHAIRDCVGAEVLDGFRKDKNKGMQKGEPRYSRGLKLGLTYVIEKKLILDTDFPAWHIAKESDAIEKYQRYVSDKMDKENLESYDWNESEIDFENSDFEMNIVDNFLSSIPYYRNLYAHGNTKPDMGGTVLHN